MAFPLFTGLADACQHLRVEPGEDDAKVLSALRAAQDYVETVTACALTPRTTVAFAYEWPADGEPLEIVSFPVYAVRILFTDLSGNTVQLAGNSLVLRQPGAGKASLGVGTWPNDMWSPGSEIRIEVDCGFPVGQVPGPLQEAAFLLMGHFYRHREGVITGTNAGELPLGVNSMLNSFRQMYLA